MLNGKTLFKKNQCHTWNIYEKCKNANVYIWMDRVDGGKIYDNGFLFSNYRNRNIPLFTRIADGEGSSHPLVLSAEMVETVRQLALSETTHEAATKG